MCRLNTNMKTLSAIVDIFIFSSKLKILGVFLWIIDCALSESACATLKVNTSKGITKFPVGDRDINKDINDDRRINIVTEWKALNASPVISVDIQDECILRICTFVDGKAYRTAKKCHEYNVTTEFDSSILKSSRWNGTTSSVLSFDCSCKKIVKIEDCIPNIISNCSSIGAALNEGECGRLYQETDCQSCRFGYVSIPHESSKLIKGMSMISSIAVRDDCNVQGWGTSHQYTKSSDFWTFTRELELNSDINRPGYGIRKFTCNCNGGAGKDFKQDVRKNYSIDTVKTVAIVLCILLIAIAITVTGYKYYKKNPIRLKLSLALQYESKHIKRLSLRDVGHFGVVYDGILKSKDGKLETVALKYVKSYSNPVYLNSIISEIKIMDAVGQHPNIVRFLGSCTQCDNEGDICIIMELCEKGSLKKYLENEDVRSAFRDVFETNAAPMHYVRFAEETDIRTDTLSTANLVTWCLDIAKGMEFISIKNIVHFDLAMRNVLLTADLTAKISDFGLSQNLQRSGYLTFNPVLGKSSIPLPVLYMAPEALTLNRLSVKSDVWAYGVCIWEIFSLGDYPSMGDDINLNDVNVRETLAKKFANGNRLQKPEFASPEIYNEIQKCWDMSPSSRPSFKELMEFFEFQVQSVNDLTLVSQFPTGTGIDS